MQKLLFIFLYFNAGFIFGANIGINKNSCELSEENQKYSICLLNHTGELLTGHFDQWILFKDSSSSSSHGSSITYDGWENGKYIVIYLPNNFFETYFGGNTSIPHTIYYSFNHMKFGWFKYSPASVKTPILSVTKESDQLRCNYLREVAPH